MQTVESVYRAKFRFHLSDQENIISNMILDSKILPK